MRSPDIALLYIQFLMPLRENSAVSKWISLLCENDDIYYQLS